MMPEFDLPLSILQACAQATPFFPARFAAETGIDRQRLDSALDRLRLNGFLEIADWVQGMGQGYTLTDAGVAALADPELLRRPVRPPEPESVARAGLSSWEHGERVRAALIDPGPPVVTRLLLFANLSLFVVGLGLALTDGISWADYLRGSHTIGPVLDTLGAVTTWNIVMEQQWWRLFSYQFLHGSLLHLVMNMLALMTLGPLLEAIWGVRRYLALYLLSGCIGGAAVVMGGRAAVGASGAICGLIAGLGAWLVLNRDRLPEQARSKMMSGVGTNLIIITVLSVTMRNVSWEGHLGGAIGGALLTAALQYTYFGIGWQRPAGWILVVVLPLIAAGAAYQLQWTKIRVLLDEARHGILFHTVKLGGASSANRAVAPAAVDACPEPTSPLRRPLKTRPATFTDRHVADYRETHCIVPRTPLDSRASASISNNPAAPIV